MGVFHYPSANSFSSSLSGQIKTTKSIMVKLFVLRNMNAGAGSRCKLKLKTTMLEGERKQTDFGFWKLVLKK